MQIVQKDVLDIKNLDAYILETIPGKIVINNQSNGLYIVTNDLTYSNDIKLLDDIEITQVYHKRDEPELLLYCEKNKKLIHVDLRKPNDPVIKVMGYLGSASLLPLYLWDDTVCLLATSEILYTLNFSATEVIKQAIYTEVEENFYRFYHCWNTYRMQEVCFFNQKEYAIGIRQEGNIVVHFVDLMLHHGPKPITVPDSVDIIDFHYRHGRIVTIKSNSIEVIDSNTHQKTTYEIEVQYAYLMARFLETSDLTFVALCQAKETKNHSQLRLYKIV